MYVRMYVFIYLFSFAITYTGLHYMTYLWGTMLSVIYMSSRLGAMKAFVLLLHEMGFKNVRSHLEKKIPILTF
jgi:hypothetical protein